MSFPVVYDFWSIHRRSEGRNELIPKQNKWMHLPCVPLQLFDDEEDTSESSDDDYSTDVM